MPQMVGLLAGALEERGAAHDQRSGDGHRRDRAVGLGCSNSSASRTGRSWRTCPTRSCGASTSAPITGRIDTAANLLREHTGDVDETAPVYLHHDDLDTLEEQSASGYRACGKADTAVAILENKIRATPGHLHRDLGHQQAKLANKKTAHPRQGADAALADLPRDSGVPRSPRRVGPLSNNPSFPEHDQMIGR